MNKPVDTIVACATPKGQGGVSIVRISGPSALNIGETLTQKKLSPGRIQFSKFFDKKKELLDEGLVLAFEQPHSFTGENVVELHGHGSPVTTQRIINAAKALGARLAKPGEFSERAFLNNKIDLVQAESIAALISAQTEQASQAALKSLTGTFSNKVTQLQQSMVALRTLIEAAIDFSDEDIDALEHENIDRRLAALREHIDETQRQASQGRLLSEGATIVIMGKPNAGKSSLLNALAQEERAIVTDIPGTTRDVLKETISIEGVPTHIIDTAGIRPASETSDEVEKEGIRRAWQQVEKAEHILLLFDAQEKAQSPLKDFTGLQKIDKQKITLIKNKIDLTNESEATNKKEGITELSISIKEHLGFNRLHQHLAQVIGISTNQEGVFLAQQRHINILLETSAAIDRAEQSWATKSLELTAEELRVAQNNLGEITGEYTTEDLLGSIFSTFCIGK